MRRHYGSKERRATHGFSGYNRSQRYRYSSAASQCPGENSNRAASLHMLIQIKGEKVGVCEIRKHVSWYLKGLKGAGQIRKLINTISCF